MQPLGAESQTQRRSAQLAALSRAILPPWQLLLPAQYLGPSSPQGGAGLALDFFPTVSRLECLPLSRTSLHPTPRMKLAARELPTQFLLFLRLLLLPGTTLPPASQNESKAASSRKPFWVYWHDSYRSGQDTDYGLEASPTRRLPGPAPTLCAKGSLSHTTAHQLGAGDTSLL